MPGWKAVSLIFGTAGVLMLLAALALGQLGGKADAAGPMSLIFIKGNAFNPASITVGGGTTVIWTNSDAATHAVASPGLFTSPSIAQGSTYAFRFDHSGTFTVKLDTGASGSITVAGNGGTNPTATADAASPTPVNTAVPTPVSTADSSGGSGSNGNGTATQPDANGSSSAGSPSGFPSTGGNPTVHTAVINIDSIVLFIAGGILTLISVALGLLRHRISNI